ncbi:MAG TPA: M3 family metallopeptidase [Bacteroidales bacterium]|nr:M3 family metallopeptidase [Bacteroidales bacterium]
MKNIFRIIIPASLVACMAVACKTEPKADLSNPFFTEYKTPWEVPPFEKIYAKHYLPAFEKGMEEARKDINALLAVKDEPTFKNTIEAYDRAGELLDRVNQVFSSQSQSNTNDSLQKLEVEINPRISAFRDEISMNPKLFERVKSVYENQAKFNLTDEEKFILENIYKGFIRRGANLKQADQDTMKAINQKLATLTVKFSQNVLAETNGYRLFITDRKDLKGLPESLVSAAADEAKSAGFEGKWAFTTKRPSIFPFITYSTDRAKREEIYKAYTMRGNNGNDHDNNKILAEIVNLRAQRAKLLGYRNHSSLVLEPNMAKTPENVDKLLMSLWEKALPVAKHDRDDMQKMVYAEGGKFKIEASDWWYYAEKLRKKKFDLDDNELRPYFKLENVRNGAFEVAHRLFGITYEPIKDIPVPNSEVQAFEIKDSSGAHLGVLYMDFFPRPGKQQGAWCTTLRTHHIIDGKETTPVISTVFNFTRPSSELPALLSLEEASTLFHEFGHSIDALFNKPHFINIFPAGDFIELPSQLMEHWCTEPEVLAMYARHYKTNEPIPAALVKKIKNSGYFNEGFITVEYLAASLLDMAYHTQEAPANVDVQKFEKEFFNKLGLIPEIVSRYRSTYFLHIMDGYDSGYYYYIWAAVLDNDVFAAFKEKGIFDAATALSYRKNLLEKNGIMDAMQSFINFRGRTPSVEPLLKNRGLM